MVWTLAVTASGCRELLALKSGPVSAEDAGPRYDENHLAQRSEVGAEQDAAPSQLFGELKGCHCLRSAVRAADALLSRGCV
jgi:hypothetical protein